MPDKALTESFTTDIGIANQLLELLDAEFAALSERNLELLQSLLDRKQPLLGLLAQHATQRSELMRRCGVSMDRAGLKIIAEHQNNPSLLENADTLAALLEQLQNRNQRNGKLIRANQTSVAGALKIMRGSDVPDLYDRRGSTARISQHKPLSQA